MSVDLDLLRSGADPISTFCLLQEKEPLHFSPQLNMWIATRFEQVEYILSTPADFSVERFRGIGEEFLKRRPDLVDLAGVLKDWAVYRDPPDHTRLRALLQHSFVRRQIETMQPRIQRIVDDLLLQLRGEGGVDFLEEFAVPLPATVITSMLGVPTEDFGLLKTYSNQIAAYLGGARGGDDIERAKQGLLSSCDYFRGLTRQRRKRPADDLLGLMLSASDERGVLDEDEVVSNCVLLLFAGHETTTNLLANGLLRLAQDPAQYALLRQRPELIPSAVEEFLRYDPPVSGTLRLCTRDLELFGQRLRRRDMVATMISAANRDPRQFERPEVLNLRRAPNRHLGFGYGIHYCLGAGLARLEAQVAFNTILRRYRAVTLADEIRWKPHLFFHGLERLPLLFRDS